ncbi:MAG TPA: glucan biosynthesis protein D [Candidatus Binatia bacterium]
MQRRSFLRTGAILAAGALPFPRFAFSAIADHHRPDEASTFDFAWLKGKARASAQAPYRPPPTSLPKQLLNLDWDGYQAIRFRSDHALWRKDPVNFRVEFFHLGRTYKEPVHMYEVVNGRTQEIVYTPSMFDLRKSGIDGAWLGKDLGFAGFRVQYQTDWQRDVAAFLGASYFRAVGGDQRQYGLSARGLALDTALNHAEEFPRFTDFWFVRPTIASGTLTLYALLDSPSVTGAYRFDISPGATLVMDVDAALYPRQAIERLGVAPLTSMFLCGENDRRVANDWRPEIHDSDGLALFTGNGEWIWRPLVNPAEARVNSFFDENPRGFGLLQRDRNFDHYQDDGVFYERRPSLWVEPKVISPSGWGKGAVQLVELAAPDETYDNIVAFWNPATKLQPGQELLFSYRLHWGTQIAFTPLAQVVATRTGIGGVVGQSRSYFSWRFAVDFTGGELAALSKNAEVEPVITASRGEIEIPSVRPQLEIDGYRAIFDIKPTDNSSEPIDLRLYLRLHGQPLTETWIYQWTPPPASERKF